LDERRAEEAFYAALEHPDWAGRETALDAACDENPELRQRVERLLAAHAGLGDFLRAPSAHLLPAEVGSGPPIDPDTITSLDDGTGLLGQVLDGRYRLLEVIGEGGMGTVYLAEQLAPVQRRVAVKLLKPGLNSAHVLFRFEAERQALAVMDHAHIARVFDGGEAPPAYAGGSRRPIFVMELVQGVPITRFCDERRLSVRERLKLFIPICQAIQHAHQKAIGTSSPATFWFRCAMAVPFPK
jgi:hypothetical protein